MQVHHAQFIQTFNTLPHSAHRDRTDGGRTPEAVLNWVHARPVDPVKLQRLVRDMQSIRMVNWHGYISIQRFYLYAERGLAKQRVSVWIYEGSVRIAYGQTMLARYAGTYDRRRKRLKDVLLSSVM